MRNEGLWVGCFCVFFVSFLSFPPPPLGGIHGEKLPVFASLDDMARGQSIYMCVRCKGL